MAGSSLPVTWRIPSLEFPDGARPEEALCVCYGGMDSYDFHGLEAKSADFVEHFFETEVIVDGVEDADGNFLFCAGGNEGASHRVSGFDLKSR